MITTVGGKACVHHSSLLLTDRSCPGRGVCGAAEDMDEAEVLDAIQRARHWQSSSEVSAGPGDQRPTSPPTVTEDGPAQFQEELEKFWSRDPKTAKHIKCEMNKKQLNWYGLYSAVQDFGGHEAVLAKGSGGWCKALRAGCPENAGKKTVRAKRIQQKYETILLPFEEEKKVQTKHQTILEQVEDVAALLGDGDESGHGEEELSTIHHQLVTIIKDLHSAVGDYWSDVGQSAGGKNSQDFMLLESLWELIKKVGGNTLSDAKPDLKTIAFVGPNRLGKSTVLDLLLQIGQLSERLYRAQNKDSNDLEAAEYLNEQETENLDTVLVPNRDDNGFDDSGKLHDRHWTRLKMKDKASREIYRKFCTDGLPNSIHPFVLPHGNEGSTMTNRGIRIRFGRRYHLSVRFKSREQICDEILGMKWDAYEQSQETEEANEPLSAADKLYFDQRIALCNSLKGCASPVRHSSSDEDEEEIDIFAANAQDEDFVPPKDVGDIEICSEIDALLGKTRIYHGQGQHIDDDRLYIQQMLQKELNILDGVRDDGVQTHDVIDEITLYVPNVLLQDGVQWVDTPGSNDVDPLKKVHMLESIDEADVVLLMMPADTGLGGNADADAMLNEHIVPRLFENDGGKPCSVHFLHTSEKIHKSTAKDTSSDDPAGWITTVKKPGDRAVKETNKRFTKILQEYKKNHADVPVEVVRKKFNECRILCVQPLLYSSLMLNTMTDFADSVSQLTPTDYATASHRTQGADLLSLVYYAGIGDTQSKVTQIRDKVKSDAVKITENIEKYLPKQLSDAVKKRAKSWSKKRDLASHFDFSGFVEGQRTALVTGFTTELQSWMKVQNQLSATDVNAAHRGLVEIIERGTKRSTYLKAFDKGLRGTNGTLPLRKLKSAVVKSFSTKEQDLLAAANTLIDYFKKAICTFFEQQLNQAALGEATETSASESAVLRELAKDFTKSRFAPQLEDSLAPLRNSCKNAVRGVRGKDGAVAKAFQANLFDGMDALPSHSSRWKAAMKSQFEANKESFIKFAQSGINSHILNAFTDTAKKFSNKLTPTAGRGIMHKAFTGFLRSVASTKPVTDVKPSLMQFGKKLTASAEQCTSLLNEISKFSDKKSKFAQESVRAMRIMHGLSESEGVGGHPKMNTCYSFAATETDMDEYGLKELTQLLGGNPQANTDEHHRAVIKCLLNQSPQCCLPETNVGVETSLYRSLQSVAAISTPTALKAAVFRQLLHKIVPLSKKDQVSRSEIEAQSKEFENTYMQGRATFQEFLIGNFQQNAMMAASEAIHDVPKASAAIIECCSMILKKPICVHYLRPGQTQLEVYRVEDPRITQYRNIISSAGKKAYHILLSPDLKTFYPMHRCAFESKAKFDSMDICEKFAVGWRLRQSKSNGHYWWHHRDVGVDEFNCYASVSEDDVRNYKAFESKAKFDSMDIREKFQMGWMLRQSKSNGHYWWHHRDVGEMRTSEDDVRNYKEILHVLDHDLDGINSKHNADVSGSNSTLDSTDGTRTPIAIRTLGKRVTIDTTRNETRSIPWCGESREYPQAPRDRRVVGSCHAAAAASTVGAAHAAASTVTAPASAGGAWQRPAANAVPRSTIDPQLKKSMDERGRRIQQNMSQGPRKRRKTTSGQAGKRKPSTPRSKPVAKKQKRGGGGGGA
jgi:hypothetical protein